MLLEMSVEQRDFRDALRDLLVKRVPSAFVRERLGDGHEPGLWRRLCAELEIPGLRVPGGAGGQGASLEETSIALHEFGRALTPVAALPAIVGLEFVFRHGSDEQRTRLLPSLMSGDQIAMAALPWVVDRATFVEVDGAKGGVTVRGAVHYVPCAHAATLLVVAARSPESPDAVELYLVDASSPGVELTRHESFDLTRPVSSILLRDARAERLGCAPLERRGYERLLDTVRLLHAAEMVGTATACLDLAVGHARTRYQFGRPIGSFQAIKHLCADMAVETDAAQAAVDFACVAAVADSAELPTASLVAHAQAVEALALCAEASVQIHGGIGFTWEHDAHLYLRRAKADAALSGTSARSRSVLADRLGI